MGQVTNMHRAMLLLMLAAGAGTRQAGCKQETPAPASSPTPVAATAPEASPAAAPTPEPRPKPTATPAPETLPAEPPPAPLPLAGDEAYPIQDGWCVIEEKADPAGRAWVEGSVLGGEKIVIATANVRRFTLDLARLRIDWEKRIVLRMDGFNSELTRKRWPSMDFVRTASGAWTVVEE